MDGSQKKGGNFINLLQIEGGTQKGGGGGGLGFPQKRGVPMLEETMSMNLVLSIPCECNQNSLNLMYYSDHEITY